MPYGRIPSQEEIDKISAQDSARQELLDTIKQELTEMEVGSWLAYKGKEGMIGAPPIEILSIGVKGKFEFRSDGNTCYVKRIK